MCVLVDEEAPLNLSTKPSDVLSSISRKSEIWSPGSVCEREAKQVKPISRMSPSSIANNNTPGMITKQIHHSPLTPPSSSERTFQVSLFIIYFKQQKKKKNVTCQSILGKKKKALVTDESD